MPLEEAGYDVIRYQDKYPEMNHRREPGDEFWLKEAGINGWVVFTADAKQRRNINEVKASKRYKVAKFILRTHGSGAELMSIIRKALPKVEQFLNDHEPPFVAKITKDSKVEEYPEWE